MPVRVDAGLCEGFYQGKKKQKQKNKAVRVVIQAGKVGVLAVFWTV